MRWHSSSAWIPARRCMRIWSASKHCSKMVAFPPKRQKRSTGRGFHTNKIKKRPRNSVAFFEHLKEFMLVKGSGPCHPGRSSGWPRYGGVTQFLAHIDFTLEYTSDAFKDSERVIFDHVAACTCVYGALCILNGEMTRQHNAREGGVFLVQFTDQVDAVHLGQ